MHASTAKSTKTEVRRCTWEAFNGLFLCSCHCVSGLQSRRKHPYSLMLTFSVTIFYVNCSHFLTLPPIGAIFAPLSHYFSQQEAKVACGLASAIHSFCPTTSCSTNNRARLSGKCFHSSNSPQRNCVPITGVHGEISQHIHMQQSQTISLTWAYYHIKTEYYLYYTQMPLYQFQYTTGTTIIQNQCFLPTVSLPNFSVFMSAKAQCTFTDLCIY